MIKYAKDNKDWKRRAHTAAAMSIPVGTGAVITGGKRFGDELSRAGGGAGKGKLIKGLKKVFRDPKLRKKTLHKAVGTGKAGAAMGLLASIPYALSNEAYLRARPQKTAEVSDAVRVLVKHAMGCGGGGMGAGLSAGRAAGISARGAGTYGSGVPGKKTKKIKPRKMKKEASAHTPEEIREALEKLALLKQVKAVAGKLMSGSKAPKLKGTLKAPAQKPALTANQQFIRDQGNVYKTKAVKVGPVMGTVRSSFNRR